MDINYLIKEGTINELIKELKLNENDIKYINKNDYFNVRFFLDNKYKSLSTKQNLEALSNISLISFSLSTIINIPSSIEDINTNLLTKYTSNFGLLVIAEYGLYKAYRGIKYLKFKQNRDKLLKLLNQCN